jgi:hypothetical protein
MFYFCSRVKVQRRRATWSATIGRLPRRRMNDRRDQVRRRADHLVRTLTGVRIVLVCYLDDSGTDKTAPALTMAGYVGALPAWGVFEQSARKILSDFGVTILHAHEFNGTKGEFARWPRRRKEAFAARLYWELRKAAEFGVSASIRKTAFAKAKTLRIEHDRKSPYGFCFGQILDQIMFSAVMKMAATFGGTISFVVESGNKNNADILRIFNEQKWSPRHVNVEKVLESLSFAEKGSSIALQMADFLAFHARRYVMQCENARDYLPLSDLQKVIFHAIPTAVSISHEFLTNEEIEAGVRDPQRWRTGTPWMP